MFNFGFNMFVDFRRDFSVAYQCFSVAMLPGNERDDVERGGKIIMPPSALDHLTRLNINYPMLFKITNRNHNRISHCGVLEFVADEGKVYLPHWMMENMNLDEGDTLFIENVTLPIGTFSKFQPVTPEFLDITNPKAVLENCLRSFACLTTGDVIAVRYNQKIYELSVLETRPLNAISIIECDMNVEFAPPIGYKEPTYEEPKDSEMPFEENYYVPEIQGFVPFTGQGNRLDGKEKKDSSNESTPPPKRPYIRGIPDNNYMIGTLQFIRKVKTNKVASEQPNEFKAFSGRGFSLRAKKE